MSNFEMRMIDEVEEQMDLFDQILNGEVSWGSPINVEDLSPPLENFPIMNISTDSH